MGEYDYRSVTEFPNDGVGMTNLLRMGSLGNVRTSTLKAFTAEQMIGMADKLP